MIDSSWLKNRILPLSVDLIKGRVRQTVNYLSGKQVCGAMIFRHPKKNRSSGFFALLVADIAATWINRC